MKPITVAEYAERHGITTGRVRRLIQTDRLRPAPQKHFDARGLPFWLIHPNASSSAGQFGPAGATVKKTRKVKT